MDGNFDGRILLKSCIIFVSGLFLLLFGNNYSKLSYVLLASYLFVEIGYWVSYYIFNSELSIYLVTSSVAVLLLIIFIAVKSVSRFLPLFLFSYITGTFLTYIFFLFIPFRDINYAVRFLK